MALLDWMTKRANTSTPVPNLSGYVDNVSAPNYLAADGTNYFAGIDGQNGVTFPQEQAYGGTSFYNPATKFNPDTLRTDGGTMGYDGLPKAEGSWIKGAKLGLSAVQTGMGIYSAINQAKMNKFMQSYYKDQMNLMKTDFTNTAKAANEALAGKQERLLSAQGYSMGSQEMTQGVADHMAKWGAKESV